MPASTRAPPLATAQSRPRTDSSPPCRRCYTFFSMLLMMNLSCLVMIIISPDVTLPHLHRAAAATPRPAAPAAAQTFCPTVSARVLFCRPLAPYPSILTPHPSHLTPTQLSGRGRSGGDVHPRQSGRICKQLDGQPSRRLLRRQRDCQSAAGAVWRPAPRHNFQHL
jgi:hypothetical protein